MTGRVLAAVLLLTCYTTSTPALDSEMACAELEIAWVNYLDLALSGGKEARVRLERARHEAKHEALRQLAAHLLAEWEVPEQDERFEAASLVWLPEIDFDSLPSSAKQVSFPGVIIRGIVTPEGSFEEIVLVKGSGSALIDQAALHSAARALFRPVRSENAYLESRAAITIHLDPK